MEYANEVLEREGLELSEPLKLVNARATYNGWSHNGTNRVQFGKGCIKDCYSGDKGYWTEAHGIVKKKLYGITGLFSMMLEELAHAKNTAEGHENEMHGRLFKEEFAGMIWRNRGIYGIMRADPRLRPSR